MKKSLIIVSFVYIILCNASIYAQQSKTATENSYTRARQVLERGIEALGGLKNFRAVDDIAFKSTAEFPEKGQSLNAAGSPYIRPVDGEGVIDLHGKRSYRLGQTVFTGGARYSISTVVTEKTGFVADVTSNAVYPLAAPAVGGNNRVVQRLFPITLLQTALSRAATLRWLGEENYAGRKQQVITFADSDGSQLTLFFDTQSDLLTKTEVLGDRFLEGLSTAENIYSNYRDVGRVKMPFHVITKIGGEIATDLTYAEIRFNTHPNEALFEAPKDAEVGPEAGGALKPITLTKLAKDVYYINAISTNGIFFYSSMFVAFKDYVMVFDSPLSTDVSDAVIAKIKETVPNKPIKYLVPTHHHIDHMGGIRGYIAEGSTIVTTPSNQRFIEKVISVPHPLNPDTLSLHPLPLSVETFKDKRVFSDGEHLVELYNLGPNPHADEIVMAYLPQVKIVYVSDLFPVNFKGRNGPTSQVFVDFYEKLIRMNLQIETIASGHGRLGTMEELRQSVIAAKKQAQVNK